MENDDDLSNTSLPNHFLLSVYKESVSINENLKETLTYKCPLCRKIFDNPILTCSNCVNTGQFCSSNHDKCTNKRLEVLINLLNQNDYEEFKQNLNDKSIHFQYSDRKFFLEKFNYEKKLLQSEFQTIEKASKETREMFEQIQIRKNRFKLIHHSIKRLREQIEQKKQGNIKTQQRIDQTRIRINDIKEELNSVNEAVRSACEKNKGKILILTKQVNRKLNEIRRERFDELHKYLFPVQQISAIEEDLATRIRALSNAQQTTVNEINNDPIENDEVLIVADYKYQIVNSCLPRNGNYQIENFPLTAHIDENMPDPESPQASISRDFHEVLSALSHACQLINVIAFYLHIHLPFRLHQLEFNTDILTIDCLRANIAKLNANIISTCLSQGVPIDLTNVSYTLENLFNLLTLPKFPSRPQSVMYSQEYMNIIQKDVKEISRTFISDYWFDDDDDDDNIKDVTDILNNDEWEAVTDIDIIPDDPYIDEYGESLSSSSSQQNSSMMSSSFGYFRRMFGFN